MTVYSAENLRIDQDSVSCLQAVDYQFLLTWLFWPIVRTLKRTNPSISLEVKG